ncbi:YcaO-like family protein [Janibacter sp. GXQ6167]|uniref:YcaO-like family protein n=1 Tax=Janibacter sp. GXQ6167 TaxID=3240791 RepID=UPI003525313E
MTALAPDHLTGLLPGRAARVEVRAVDALTSVVTTPRRKTFRVPVPARELILLLDEWSREVTAEHSARPDLHRAAEGVRHRLIEEEVWAPAPREEMTEALGVATFEGVSAVVTGDEDTAAIVAEVLAAGGARVRTLAFDQRAVVNDAYARGDLLVVAVHGPRDDDLVDLDRTAHDMRVRWLPIELGTGDVWAGPLVTPGTGASYEELVARRAAAAPDRRIHRALRRPSLTGDAGPPLDSLSPATALALQRALRDGHDRVVEVSGATGEIVAHPVLPMPGSPTTHRPHQPDDLVDPATGLVLRTRTIAHDASVPASLHTRQCDVADIRAVSRWANNILCQGSAFDDPEGAALGALGESVERYCGNILDTLPVRRGSWHEFNRAGTRALDPDRLVLYSSDQYAAKGFPFSPLRRDTVVDWVPGTSLTTGEDLLVPASLVYVNWYAAGYSGVPITNFCAFAGIAAGPDRDFAVMSALEEVVERHATMLWWLAGHPMPGVQASDALNRLWAGTDPAHQRASLIHLDNEMGIPVMAGVVHDDTDRLVNIGFSARHDPQVAAAKAWTEALTLQEGSRDLLRMDGHHWGVMARGELNGRAFKPWRADRAYLDDFRPDMHDCDDLMVQQQVYLDPRAGERMRHLLQPPTTRTMDSLPRLPERSRAAYQQAIEAAGYEVIVVDITTPDVASTGLSVVRAIVPGTIGNAPAAFPFLGRDAVSDLALRLGWRDAPLAEADINLFPLPHA